MGWLDAVKGALVEDDGPKKQADAVKPVATTVVTPIAPGISTVPAHTVISTSYGANPEMVASIRQGTMARKTPYTALLEAADKLANVIPDSTTRLKAAYAMIGDNRSVASISNAIDLHVQDVQGEKMRFAQQATAKRAATVDPLKKQVSDLSTQNQNISTEISNINQRIQQLQETQRTNEVQISTLTGQAQQKETEIAAVEAQFDAAATQVCSDLEQQRAAITSTLN